MAAAAHEVHVWRVDVVRALVADHDLFDGVVVLEVDRATSSRRLDARPDEEWGGGEPTARDRVVT